MAASLTLWVPKRIFHQVPYFTYADRYGMMLWGTPLRVMLVENEMVAASYRKQFNETWSNARIPELPKGIRPYFHQYPSLVD